VLSGNKTPSVTNGRQLLTHIYKRFKSSSKKLPKNPQPRWVN